LAIGAGLLLPLGVFAALVVEARMRKTASWDRELTRSLYRYNAHGTFLTHATGLLEGVIARPAQIAGLLVLAALVCVLAWRRRFRAALLIVAAVTGTLLLEPAVKDLVRRPAPHPGNRGYSFPSGTAMRAMAAAAAVAVTAWRSRWRWPAVALGTAAVGLVGLGVVFDGWHWASDVIGGWCLAVAWVAVLALALREG
jgi:undecaprenyl-diphosphatase